MADTSAKRAPRFATVGALEALNRTIRDVAKAPGMTGERGSHAIACLSSSEPRYTLHIYYFLVALRITWVECADLSASDELLSELIIVHTDLASIFQYF